MSNSFKEKAEKRRASASNPAMMFISPQQAEERPTEPKKSRSKGSSARTVKAHEEPLSATPLYTTRAPQGREAKTRRLQLLLTPSLYEAVKRRADTEGISVNEIINEILRRNV